MSPVAAARQHVYERIHRNLPGSCRRADHIGNCRETRTVDASRYSVNRRRVCFFAGRGVDGISRAAPAQGEDLDRARRAVVETVEALGFNCMPAPVGEDGAYTDPLMRERILMADRVVVDLTAAGPAVALDIGVRLGVPIGRTVLVRSTAEESLLPGGVYEEMIISYAPDANDVQFERWKRRLEFDLRRSLVEGEDERLSEKNILVNLSDPSGGGVPHRKVDQFIESMADGGEYGRRVAAILEQLNDDGEAIAQMQLLERELIGNDKLPDRGYSALLAIYLGYRERKAYRQIAQLFARLPIELQQNPVAIEQGALALNRISEEEDRDGNHETAMALRRVAADNLKAIPQEYWTSETYSILGRIHKTGYEATAERDPTLSELLLDNAITAYEDGFRDDPRDSYPGINAVTMRLVRGAPEDLRRAQELALIVEFTVTRRPPPAQGMERYWHAATLLELATAQRNWNKARERMSQLVDVTCEAWMRETTIKNMQLQKSAFGGDDATQLDDIIRHLKKPPKRR